MLFVSKASMISGLDVVVSFRTTYHGAGGRSYNGQPLVAIGYDSRVDKFRKIELLWPNLYAGGTTQRDYVSKLL